MKALKTKRWVIQRGKRFQDGYGHYTTSLQRAFICDEYRDAKDFSDPSEGDKIVAVYIWISIAE